MSHGRSKKWGKSVTYFLNGPLWHQKIKPKLIMLWQYSKSNNIVKHFTLKRDIIIFFLVLTKLRWNTNNLVFGIDKCQTRRKADLIYCQKSNYNFNMFPWSIEGLIIMISIHQIFSKVTRKPENNFCFHKKHLELLFMFNIWASLFHKIHHLVNTFLAIK